MKSDSLVLPDKIYTVGELTQLVKLTLETSFPQVWVVGEVSNFHRHSSGHLYFSLKDEKSQLRAVMWRSDAARVKFALKDGLQLVCRGRINVYEPRGEYQIVVDAAEPKGKGALQLAFEQLKDKLKAEGLFEEGRKRKLPLLPKKIGIVTSPRGAALFDMLRTIERRFAKLEILIYPAKVQGEGAAEEIAAGIDYLGALVDLDAIIVGRGGGSMEDLWAFNEEKVARAIARCPVPVISAVGHEVDFTIADFVADIRASTPTAAAEMVVEKEEAFADRIDNLERRGLQSVKFAIEERRSGVVGLAQHRIFQNFQVRLMNLGRDVDDLEERAWDVVRGEQKKIAETKARAEILLERIGSRFRGELRDGRARAEMAEERIASVFRAILREKQGLWEKLAAELHGHSPLNILRKGYALVWSGDGTTAVTEIGCVREADEMLVSFFRGEFRCRVEGVDRETRIESRAVKDE